MADRIRSFATLLWRLGKCMAKDAGSALGRASCVSTCGMMISGITLAYIETLSSREEQWIEMPYTHQIWLHGCVVILLLIPIVFLWIIAMISFASDPETRFASYSGLAVVGLCAICADAALGWKLSQRRSPYSDLYFMLMPFGLALGDSLSSKFPRNQSQLQRPSDEKDSANTGSGNPTISLTDEKSVQLEKENAPPVAPDYLNHPGRWLLVMTMLAFTIVHTTLIAKKPRHALPEIKNAVAWALVSVLWLLSTLVGYFAHGLYAHAAYHYIRETDCLLQMGSIGGFVAATSMVVLRLCGPSQTWETWAADALLTFAFFNISMLAADTWWMRRRVQLERASTSRAEESSVEEFSSSASQT